MSETALASAADACKRAYAYLRDTLLVPARSALSAAWAKVEPVVARVPLDRRGWTILGCVLGSLLLLWAVLRCVIRALFLKRMDVQDKFSRRIGEHRKRAAALLEGSGCLCCKRARAQPALGSNPFPPMLRVSGDTFLLHGDRLGLPPMLAVVNLQRRLVLYAPHVLPEEQMRELEALAAPVSYEDSVVAIFSVQGDDSGLYKKRYPGARVIRSYKDWKAATEEMPGALDILTLVQATRSAKKVSSCFFLASEYSEDDSSFSDTVCIAPQGLVAAARPRLPCDARGWCKRRSVREYCDTLVRLSEGALVKCIAGQDTELQPQTIIYQDGQVEIGPEYAGASLLAAAGRLSPKYSERALAAVNAVAGGDSDGGEDVANAARE